MLVSESLLGSNLNVQAKPEKLRPSGDRKLSTNHELHHNILGKQYLFHQISSMVYSLFEQKTTCPVSLSWNKPDGSISEDNSLNTVTTRNRKLQITRSKDFLE